jgi:hypothetical protein
VVVAVNVGGSEVIVDIRQLNPTGHQNAVFEIRSIGSQNPLTAPG